MPKDIYKLNREIPYDDNVRMQTFISWRKMQDRCYNENTHNYHNYGGRGITVCDRWREYPTGFDNFVEDMGLRPDRQTLDRIDPDGNYEPGNTKWATKLEQGNNKRKKPGVGVHYFKKAEHWQAYISIFNKKVHLGVAKDKETAIKMRESAQVLKDYFTEIGLYSDEHSRV